MQNANKKPRTDCQKLHDTIIKIDLFGSIMDKENNDGVRIYRSIFGAFISVAFVVVLALYTGEKFYTLMKYNDTSILISSQEGYYTAKDVFKGGKGKFNVAFGLISFEPGDTSTDVDYSDYG